MGELKYRRTAAPTPTVSRANRGLTPHRNSGACRIEPPRNDSYR